MALSPRQQTGEAYFTGDASKEEKTRDDAEVDARLGALEDEIAEVEKKQQ